jgi:hypothetical protein
MRSTYQPFLTHNRLDLAIKVAFLKYQHLGKNSIYSRLYSKHLAAFSYGTYREPGNDQKNTLNDFIKEFYNLYEAFDQGRFILEKSPIPIASDGSIINGAHRAACAFYLKKHLISELTNHPPVSYGADFFLSRGLERHLVELSVKEFVAISKNCYVALIWPAAKGKDQDLNSLFSRVVYKKKIKIGVNGLHNIVTQAYRKEQWLGDIATGYYGAYNKVNAIMDSDNPLRIYIFQADSITDVIRIKSQIRDIFGIDKNSIHISDTAEEAIALSKLLLNENSLHFINNSHPYKFVKTQLLLDNFRKTVQNKNGNLDDYALDSGMVLGIYGLRRPNDLDYLTTQKNLESNILCDHSVELKYHNHKVIDLIYDPSLYFVFEGVKFISIFEVSKMKHRRRHEKDIIDIKLIDSLGRGGLGYKRIYQPILRFKVAALRARGRLKSYIAEKLRRLGLLEPALKVLGKKSNLS